MTTTFLTAPKIHEIGLAEVKTIHERMDKLLKSAGFVGTRQEYAQKLHREPEYFYTKREEIIQGYQKLAEKIEPNLSLLFEKIPQLGYKIEPVPEHSEKSNPAAYYVPGTISTQRPGIFFANTYQPEKRPK
ncbi:6951_t:CDS:1 [Ambispora leptoticha]|uniref:6951_t:CDS:1 n=1 Tax=Ambispora leptoticha TaxID=144679 RepID=A0A9N8YP70_9GLOM|nr:6951_t:CDS:1 [Ambispora leptoticha]